MVYNIVDNKMKYSLTLWGVWWWLCTHKGKQPIVYWDNCLFHIGTKYPHTQFLYWKRNPVFNYIPLTFCSVQSSPPSAFHLLLKGILTCNRVMKEQQRDSDLRESERLVAPHGYMMTWECQKLGLSGNLEDQMWYGSCVTKPDSWASVSCYSWPVVIGRHSGFLLCNVIKKMGWHFRLRPFFSPLLLLSLLSFIK